MGRIAAEVVSLHFTRNVHRAINEIIAENEELPPSLIYGYLHTTYANAQSNRAPTPPGRSGRSRVRSRAS